MYEEFVNVRQLVSRGGSEAGILGRVVVDVTSRGVYVTRGLTLFCVYGIFAFVSSARGGVGLAGSFVRLYPIVRHSRIVKDHIPRGGYCSKGFTHIPLRGNFVQANGAQYVDAAPSDTLVKRRDDHDP